MQRVFDYLQSRPTTSRSPMPISIATPENIGELDGLEFNGVAVISGILKNDNPREKALNYNQALKEK